MPLDGGARLMAHLGEMGRQLGSGTVSAGIYDPEIAQYAYYNEYGTRNAPARPFMRTTFMLYSHDWVTEVKRQIQAGGRRKDVLDAVGLRMARDICFTVASANSFFRPNSKKTIARKGHDRVLVDTMAMFKAVSYRVEKVKR